MSIEASSVNIVQISPPGIDSGCCKLQKLEIEKVKREIDELKNLNFPLKFS